MDIAINQTGNNITIELNGNMNTPNANKFLKSIEPVSQLSSVNITIDCKNLEYVCSTGLRGFIYLLKSTKKNNSTLCVANINDNIKDVFKTTGFLQIFNII